MSQMKPRMGPTTTTHTVRTCSNREAVFLARSVDSAERDFVPLSMFRWVPGKKEQHYENRCPEPLNACFQIVTVFPKSFCVEFIRTLADLLFTVLAKRGLLRLVSSLQDLYSWRTSFRKNVRLKN
jgi:hypothetical protein